MNSDVTNLIRDLELELLQPNVRSSFERLSELLAEDFLEFGVSGRVYTKQEVLTAVPFLPATKHIMHDFKAREVASGIVLVTYRVEKELENDQRSVSLRSSLWQNREGRWQMIFHQGTLRNP